MEFAFKITTTENGKAAPEYDTDFTGKLTLQNLLDHVKGSLISIAKDALEEEQGKGFDKTPVLIVDGRYNKAIADVKPFGKIEYVARQDMDQILLETYQAILDRSPFLTGDYKSSNYVLLNGTTIATNMDELIAWLATNPGYEERDFFRFVNIEPYARKLERLGVTYGNEKYSTRSTRFQKDRKTGVLLVQANGTYYLTSRSIRRKYKANSVIAFSYITGDFLGLNNREGGKHHFKKENGKRTTSGRTYLYPCITISVVESGITNV